MKMDISQEILELKDHRRLPLRPYEPGPGLTFLYVGNCCHWL